MLHLQEFKPGDTAAGFTVCSSCGLPHTGGVVRCVAPRVHTVGSCDVEVRRLKTQRGTHPPNPITGVGYCTNHSVLRRKKQI